MNSKTRYPTKRAKYGNAKVEWNGNVFDSRKELKRYKDLMLLVMGGEIKDLRRQVSFLLIEAVWEPVIGKSGQPLKRKKCIERRCDYVADYVYVNMATGETIVEDVKGMQTEVFRIKKKLMRLVHGIEIKIV